MMTFFSWVNFLFKFLLYYETSFNIKGVIAIFQVWILVWEEILMNLNIHHY